MTRSQNPVVAQNTWRAINFFCLHGVSWVILCRPLIRRTRLDICELIWKGHKLDRANIKKCGSLGNKHCNFRFTAVYFIEIVHIKKVKRACRSERKPALIYVRSQKFSQPNQNPRCHHEVSISHLLLEGILMVPFVMNIDKQVVLHHPLVGEPSREDNHLNYVFFFPRKIIT